MKTTPTHCFKLLWLLVLTAASALNQTRAAQLSGTYTIDPTQPASTFNFQNMQSAVTFMTSASARTDLGPQNTAPFGVNGPVVFLFPGASAVITEQVIIPAITGASTTNTVTFQGNGATIQYNYASTANYSIIRLSGAKYVTLDSLMIKTTSASYGWGVHFYTNADSNTVSRCTFDYTLATTVSSTTAAIVFSNSLTSPTTSGANGKGNLITNNYIKGSTAGNPYYGITLVPQSSSATASYNKIINNIIENCYIYPMYVQYTNGSLIKNNIIRNPSKTNVTTTYGMYCANGMLKDTITGNTFTALTSGAPTTTIGTYGIYMASTNISLGSEVIISNNVFSDFRSNGPQYAIYLSFASNVKIYHNTISLDYASSTAGNTIGTYGLYADNGGQTGGVDFRNNIISINRAGAALKTALYIPSTGPTYTFNNNTYWVNGQNANLVFLNGIYANLSAWKGSNNNQYDQLSYSVNPGFTNAAAGNFVPTQGLINNSGANLSAVVTTDIAGNPRIAPVDPGAYEFSSTSMNDAAVSAIALPAGTLLPGTVPVRVKVKNAGQSTLGAFNINWSVNGTLQAQVPWTGTLNPGDTTSFQTLGNINMVSGTRYDILAWSSDPNYAVDDVPGNDTSALLGKYTLLSAGTYTLNGALAAGSGNFQSFNQVSQALSAGISGAVTINVAASSGPYNEQVSFGAVAGASATNTITINGNGQTLQFNPVLDYTLVRLNGAKYFTLNNLVIKSLGTSIGWGIHFINSADSNTISGCTIDLTGLSGASTTGAGIVFSASLTSPTTAGDNGKGNLITGNTISGHISGGPYYAITLLPAAAAATATNNKLVNNIIQNFYNMGVYMQYTFGTLIKGNTIRNNNRTSNTTFYGIYSTSGSRSDTLINNIIENPFGTFTTNTNTIYGIYFTSPSVPTTNTILVANNILRNFASNGVIYGIYGSTVSNAKFYHNTIAIENPSSTGVSNTYGFYHTGAPTGNGLDFRNNIVYINRPLSTNYNMYIGTAGIYTINNNVYYKPSNAASSNVGYYVGTTAATMAAWKAVNAGAYDAASVLVNPAFVNAASNLTPQEGFINNLGANLSASVATDITGAARGTTPDPGAYEFTPPANDAGVESITPPVSPFAPSSQPISVKVRNSGTATITSVTINWSVNGALQTPYSWTGSLAPANISASIPVGNYTFAGLTKYTILAWTSNPNGTADVVQVNDSASASNIYASIPGGVYTINKNAAASSSNVQSFTDMATLLSNGGITGQVTFNVVSGSGPYTEQVLLGKIPGSSASRRIIINGNNELLQYNNTDASKIYVVGLNDADYVSLSNLRITALNATYGVGVLLTNNADTNVIDGCVIDMSANTSGSSTSNAGIALTGSVTSVNTAPATSSGAANIIQNNTILGGASIGCYYGIIMMATSSTNASYSNNIIQNNLIQDPYVYGIYTSNSAKTAIRSNTITRPNKTSFTTFYGIYMTSGSQADTVEKNTIMKPFEQGQTNTNSAYGIALSSTNPQAATPTLIRNNIITDFKFAGIMYGIYSATNAYVKIYHNTINVDHAASTAASATYGIYNSGTATTFNIKNNLVNINRGGSGTKYCLYFATTSATGYQTNNNALRCVGTNAYIGYYSANFTTLANWKTANTNAFDQASVSADPLFRNGVNALFLQPGNDSLNNKGANLLSDVPVDFANAARTATPDPGAYEFTVEANDAGISRLVGLSATAINPIAIGTRNIDAVLKNYGTSVLTSASIDWSIDGAMQATYYWSGSANPGDTNVASLGSYNFAIPALYSIKAWSGAPNGSPDNTPINDTVSVRVCTPLGGTLTINPALPATGTNFTTFASLVQALQSCGLGAPLTVNVAPGTYNEQVVLNNALIPGASSLNPVSFVGSDSALCRILYNGAASRPTLLLNGGKYFTFRNLHIEANGSSQGHAVHLMNAADSNTFVKCSFIAPITTSSSYSAFVVSSSLTSQTSTGNNASYLLVDSCSAAGGYYCVTLNGNTVAPLGRSNTFNHSVIKYGYYYGMYIVYQDNPSLLNSQVMSIGNDQIIAGYGIYITNCQNGLNIMNNAMIGQNAGYGIYHYLNIGNSGKHNVIANNMIQFGGNTTTTNYAIYENSTAYTDYAHNTINFTYLGGGYNNSAFYLVTNTTATYNNLRIVNNIFRSATGGVIFKYNDTPGVSKTISQFDNNCFYSNAPYPFSTQVLTAGLNYISNALANWRNFQVFPNNNSSMFLDPGFVSNTNLRSQNLALDGMGVPVTQVPTDIDGNARSTTNPDIGVLEFSAPPNDAGAIAISQPVAPFSSGLSDVKVVIRNFGSSPLTTANVYYEVNSSVQSIAWTGNIAQNGVDTVTFNATSGPGGTSQQYNFAPGAVSIKAYTSMPNGNPDATPANDTIISTGCTGLAGNYTINPAGSGASNFASLTEAIDKLNCGGVTASVTFNIAAGTYNERISIGTIPGASATSRIMFRSANGNAASVIITSSSSTSTSNYTVNLLASNFVEFNNVTIANTNTTYSRIVRIAKNNLTNTVATDLTFRGCVFNGPVLSTTSIDNCLLIADANDNPNNVYVKQCTFNNGSYAIYLNGTAIINLSSVGTEIDSSTFNNSYGGCIYLLYRNAPKLRYNTINGNASYTAGFGIQLSLTANSAELTGNNVNMPEGSYGIFFNAHNNYTNDIGFASCVNNLVYMGSASTTTYGIRLSNTSYTNVFNNSVRLASASTTSNALYVGGQTGSSLTATTQGIRMGNNLLYAGAGVPLYIANIQGIQATIYNDYNLYSTTGATVASINIANYSSVASIRNLINYGNDLNSLAAPISFISAGSLMPLASAANAWNVNGRAGNVFFTLPYDYSGAPRSQTPATGASDIGAYEIKPTSKPAAATLTGSIAYGNTQAVIDNGDTVATVTWSYSGMLPSTLTARYYPGSLVSDPAGHNVNWSPAAHMMDMHLNLLPSNDGISYDYTIAQRYKPTMLGTVPSESELVMAKRDSGVYGWTTYPYVAQIDTVAKTMTLCCQNSFGDFSGTDINSPLPVKLTSFEAQAQQADALLDWTTASELNSSHFEIERSENGRRFTRIATVKAAGNTSSLQRYHYNDAGIGKVINGNVVYYRLRMTDRDGHFDYSATRTVVFNRKGEDAAVTYPNPFSSEVSMQFSSELAGKASIRVYDVFGKLVLERSEMLSSGLNTVTLDKLEGLRTGIYIARVSIGSKEISARLIKE